MSDTTYQIERGSTPPRRYSAVAVAVVLLVTLMLGACETGSVPPSSPTKLMVITTLYPLEYLARSIGSGRVEVVNLVPPGVEPHDWEPSPQDIAIIRGASILIYNGSGFEPWAERVVASLSASGPLVVNATDGLALLSRRTDDYGDDRETASDPHVWLDPRRYGEQAKLIVAALNTVDPPGKEIYQANLARFMERLERLEEEMQDGLAFCQRKAVVVSHAAFGYLTERYGLEQVAISGLSPEAEPSPARMREVIQKVRSLGTTHIFFESLASPAVARTVAREVGAQTLVLNPLEGLTSEELQRGEDYFTVMRKNLANLRTALACQ